MMIRMMIFLLLCCCTLVRADLLDDVSRQLDLLEKEYWRSQYSATGDYREGVERRLRTLVANVNKITNQLRKTGKHRIADINSPMGTLLGNYGRIKPATIKRFSLTFSGTSMRDYTREFRSLLRDKEEAEARKNEQEGKKVKKERSSSRRLSPTLANVDLIEYERWVAEVVASNMDKFVSKKNNGSDSERDKMNDQVSIYLTAVKNIRIGLVKIRQQTKQEFK